VFLVWLRGAHRPYEYGSGAAKGGKRVSDLPRVPGYWPDNETVSIDMLDYASRSNIFDRHLGAMVAALEKRGLLENTLIVVTGDNGMPFPHGKGQTYPDSNHLPLAVMWKGAVKTAGRTVDDYVSFIDLAPTFLEAAGLSWKASGMASFQGRSLAPLLFSDRSGRVDSARDHALVGRERNVWGARTTKAIGVAASFGTIRLSVQFRTVPLAGLQSRDGESRRGRQSDEDRSDQMRHTRPDARACGPPASGNAVPKSCTISPEIPTVLCNLAGAMHARFLQTALHDQLFAELRAQSDPRVLGNGQQFDEYPDCR
jgi:hypothetical protein